MKTSARRLPLVLSIIASVLLLGACASGQLKPDIDFSESYDFSTVHKVAFFEGSGDVSGDNPLQLSDFQVERINKALGDAVASRGVEVVTDVNDADLLLSWHLATQYKTDVRTYETPAVGYGYGRGYGGYNRYSMYSCWSCSNTEVSVSNYTEGTFIIDMIDPGLKKSVWRSVTQSKLKGDHEYDEGKYNEAAARLIGSFPPTPEPEAAPAS
jgi:hypothetical protein